METATHTLITGRAEYIMSCQIEGKTRQTLDLYSRVTGKFCDFLGDKPLASVTQGGVRSYLVSMDGCSPVTINIHFRTLRAFFNFLVKNNYIEKSPMNGLKTPKVPELYPRILTEEEVSLLLKAARPNQRDFAIVMLMIDTGIRASELVGVNLDDVDLARKCARIYGKGQKERYVYYSKPVAKALARWLAVRKPVEHEDCFFLNCRGEPLTRSGVLQLVRRVGKRAGLENKTVSPHVLRHCFASYFAREGGDPHSLQRLLGHSSTRMAERYVHMAGIDVAEAHRKYSPVGRLERRRKS